MILIARQRLTLRVNPTATRLVLAVAGPDDAFGPAVTAEPIESAELRKVRIVLTIRCERPSVEEATPESSHEKRT